MVERHRAISPQGRKGRQGHRKGHEISPFSRTSLKRCIFFFFPFSNAMPFAMVSASLRLCVEHSSPRNERHNESRTSASCDDRMPWRSLASGKGGHGILLLSWKQGPGGIGKDNSVITCRVPFRRVPFHLFMATTAIKPVTFIDWSDTEGMFGLLVELVADERAECQNDPERLRFMEDLVVQLRTLEQSCLRSPPPPQFRGSRVFMNPPIPGLQATPVVAHLKDLI